MTEINILTKSQGQSLTRLNDEPWNKLIEIDKGQFIENNDSIILKTVSGLELKANKSEPYDDNSEMTSYWIELDAVGGPQALFDKLKNKPNTYIIRGFYPGSFLLAFSAESDFKNSESDENSSNPNFTRKRHLDGQQLALLFQALHKGLFPKPKKGFVLYETNRTEGGCNLFFDNNYFSELQSSINEHYDSGSFAKSNAEYDWNNLKHTIDDAEFVSDIDTFELKEYEISI